MVSGNMPVHWTDTHLSTVSGEEDVAQIARKHRLSVPKNAVAMHVVRKLVVHKEAVGSLPRIGVDDIRHRRSIRAHLYDIRGLSENEFFRP